VSGEANIAFYLFMVILHLTPKSQSLGILRRILQKWLLSG